MAPCTRTNCGTCVHECTFERIYSSLNCDTCIFLWHPTEEAQADAEYTAAVNELIGLEQTDDVTPQAPLSTVSPIGNIPPSLSITPCLSLLLFSFANFSRFLIFIVQVKLQDDPKPDTILDNKLFLKCIFLNMLHKICITESRTRKKKGLATYLSKQTTCYDLNTSVLKIV